MLSKEEILLWYVENIEWLKECRQKGLGGCTQDAESRCQTLAKILGIKDDTIRCVHYNPKQLKELEKRDGVAVINTDIDVLRKMIE